MAGPLPQVQETDEGPEYRNQVLAWAQQPDGQRVTEAALPSILASALASRRAERPSKAIQVVAFRVLSDGKEIVRIGPEVAPPSLNDLTAVTITVAVSDGSGVHVDAYILAEKASKKDIPRSAKVSQVERTKPSGEPM
jgi:hypothetical protein